MLLKSEYPKVVVITQTVLAFALVAIAAFIGVNAEEWSHMFIPDVRFMTFMLIAVLYAVVGIPSLMEGVMTMWYDKSTNGEGKAIPNDPRT